MQSAFPASLLLQFFLFHILISFKSPVRQKNIISKFTTWSLHLFLHLYLAQKICENFSYSLLLCFSSCIQLFLFCQLKLTTCVAWHHFWHRPCPTSQLSEHGCTMTTVFSSVLSPAESMLNYVSVTGFLSPFHIYRLWCIIPLLRMENEWDVRYSMIPHLLVYIPLHCCVPVMPFRKLLWRLFLHYSHPEQGPVCGFLAAALFCVVQLVLFPKEQSRLLSHGTPASFVLQKEQWGCSWTWVSHAGSWKNISITFFISFTAIKGWSLELSPSLPLFLFFVLPSKTALESNHAHLFQMEIILRLQDTNPLECVDRSSLWVSLLALSIYFHLNQLSLKAHKTWSSAMCVFHYEKSWAHIVDISLTASLQMLIWTC